MEPEFRVRFISICLPSIQPTQLGLYRVSRKVCALAIVDSGMSCLRNVFHTAPHTRTSIGAATLFKILTD
jgi:hypothetical protein